MTSPRSTSARPVVAVIDIGSNSIKLLVATRLPEGSSPVALTERTIEARISAGIDRQAPRLAEEGMQRGLAAILELLVAAAPFSPQRIALVATSAVRDAQNGGEFAARVEAATGQKIRILDGVAEANLIGCGLTCDPALAALRDFYVFDLGGGSLECLAFRDRRIEQAVSLQLGCVRLTEKFIPDATLPFSEAAARAVSAYTRQVIADAGFAFTLPAGATAVATGGSAGTVRAIAGEQAGRTFEAAESLLRTARIRDLLTTLGALSLAERKKIPGLPPTRADIFPTALATLIAVAELGRFAAFRHSLLNLRFGLAAELLEN